MSFARLGLVSEAFSRASGRPTLIRHQGGMTPKTAPRGWYKGVGAKSLGRHTKKGSYILDPAKIPNYVVPDLTDCPLKPYVAKNVPPPKRPPHKAPTLEEMLAHYKVKDVRELAVKAIIAQQPSVATLLQEQSEQSTHGEAHGTTAESSS